VIRGIGLRGAVAVNVITMIGIGPLVTIPLVLAQLHGSTALVAWVVGALIALCDGLAWAELGSLYPGSGGTYLFLREAFGAQRWGRLFAFLFAWQIVLSAPLVLASGYIGFAQYATYFWAPLADWRAQGALAAAVGVLTLVLLYRPIARVGAIGVGLAGVAVATVAGVIAASLAHFSPARAAAADPHVGFIAALAAGLGPALVITLYDYYGYGAACTVGEEVRAPARVLPRSVLLSILIVGLLYVALQVGVLGAIPWHELVPTPSGDLPGAAKYVASTVVEHAWGSPAARIVTLAVLATAFASTFGNLLAYSRIPYAAAVDGLFFRPFARLSERGKFPAIALLVIGLLALPACFMSLGNVINALTTGLVIVQSVAQLGAVAALRARGVRAPYRMWLYPVPALIALAGWVYIFFSAGTQAIAFGILSLLAGLAAFAWRARRATEWPFAAKAAATLGLALGVATLISAQPAQAATWGHSAIVDRRGDSIFEVDRKPFFMYGAAFFYERIPRDMWERSMRSLQSIGINTLDVYVPWNWHELSDGDFDFDGRTNPRRDLNEVLRLARTFGFKIVLRPGPVIRNEWRNGGYPAWLLSRPEYGMPQHDLLEGRYPPTATLQNAHSDAAAGEWMHNATHMSYAKRWLERVLYETAPYADLVIAVALDDDQGAYIDNDTYPAPHLRSYLEWLRGVVWGITGASQLTFINTYQMKVAASSPVWAMGNWYQSDAYSIGEHDLSQLELSFGMLETRPQQPLFSSEFQAGWLQGPNEAYPRAADPSNTGLALATMIGMGLRGVVNFPAQDTVDPGGWEAPFANWFYDWDAAVMLDGRDESERARPTREVGNLVRMLGPEFAASRPRFDAAIAYLASARTDAGETASVESDADDVQGEQALCRSAGLNCRVVDVEALSPAQLGRFNLLLVRRASSVTADAARKFLAFSRLPRHAIADPHSAGDLLRALAAVGRLPTVRNVPGGRFADDTTGTTGGFLSATNYSPAPIHVHDASIDLDGRVRALPDFAINPHSGFVIALDLPLALVDRRFSKSDVIEFSTCMPAEIFKGFDAFKGVDAPNVALPPNCRIDVRVAGRHSSIATGPASGEPEFAVISRDGSLRLQKSPGDPPFLAPTTTIGNHIDGEGLWAKEATSPDVDPDLFSPRLGDAYSQMSGPIPPGAQARTSQLDLYRDGSQDVVLDNGIVALAIDPDAGARSFNFAGVFTTIGGLRDDVAIEPPLSVADHIARYTHQMPAGTFNRPYEVQVIDGTVARARFRYEAPDVVPAGATFDRTVSLAPGATTFAVDETATFASSDTPLASQRAVTVTSLGFPKPWAPGQQLLSPQARQLIPGTVVHANGGNALGLYSPLMKRLATIAWRSGDVEDAAIQEIEGAIIVRLTLAPGHVSHVEYGIFHAETGDDANSRLAAADAAAQATQPFAPQVAPSGARTP